jgi:hypothetical protein
VGPEGEIYWDWVGLPAIFSVVYGNTIDRIAGDKGVAVPTYKSHVQGMAKAQQHLYLITFRLTRLQTGIYTCDYGKTELATTTSTTEA